MNSMLKRALAASAMVGLTAGGAFAQSTTPPAGATSSGSAAPGVTIPGTTNPGMANPGTTNPGMANPSVVTPAQQPVDGQMGAPGSAPAGKGTDSNGAAFSTPGSAAPAPNSNLAATPAKGANSFTKGEAQGRMQANGFTDASNLALDHDGIWRADATKDGKPVKAWLDYKGQVGQQ